MIIDAQAIVALDLIRWPKTKPTYVDIGTITQPIIGPAFYCALRRGGRKVLATSAPTAERAIGAAVAAWLIEDGGVDREEAERFAFYRFTN